MKPLAALIALCASAFLCAHAADLPKALLNAHAHNDYEHQRPFWEAFELGFCNVEADIHLVDGHLLVAHDLKAVKPERTLQALYLDPLQQLARDKKISPTARPMTLLIDVKSTANPTYEALDNVLQQYASMLTRFEDGKTYTNAVTVVVSGNRAREFMLSQKRRFATYDARLADLDSTEPSSFTWWVSDNWPNNFAWRGEGELSASDDAKLKGIVEKAHARGRKLRFWGMKDNATVWRMLQTHGVDILGADDLHGLHDFLSRP